MFIKYTYPSANVSITAHLTFIRHETGYQKNHRVKKKLGCEVEEKKFLTKLPGFFMTVQLMDAS